MRRETPSTHIGAKKRDPPAQDNGPYLPALEKFSHLGPLLLAYEGSNAMSHARQVSRVLFAALVLALATFGSRAMAAPSRLDLLTPGELVWCGDQEGGGPYVYPADDDPNRVVGFEVELAAKVASRLGRRATFFQGQWDKMPELLRTRKCDIVLNGYEWSASRL